MKYQEFVKKEFSKKPAGVPASVYMKEIGLKWKKANTGTKKKTKGGMIPVEETMTPQYLYNMLVSNLGTMQNITNLAKEGIKALLQTHRDNPVVQTAIRNMIAVANSWNIPWSPPAF